MSKLWPVYCVSGMQMCLLSTRQILHFVLKVKDNKSGFTFCNKFGNTVLSATLNLQGNIQIVRTCIFKNNISNPISLTTRHLEFEILHHCFKYTSNEVICHILDNVEDTKKIHFPTQKHVYHSCILGKIHQYSFSKNSVHSSKLLGLIYSDFLKLSTLFYSKYKQVITFLDDYSFYCNIGFLCKKSEAAKAIML